MIMTRSPSANRTEQLLRNGAPSSSSGQRWAVDADAADRRVVQPVVVDQAGPESLRRQAGNGHLSDPSQP